MSSNLNQNLILISFTYESSFYFLAQTVRARKNYQNTSLETVFLFPNLFLFKFFICNITLYIWTLVP